MFYVVPCRAASASIVRATEKLKEVNGAIELSDFVKSEPNYLQRIRNGGIPAVVHELHSNMKKTNAKYAIRKFHNIHGVEKEFSTITFPFPMLLQSPNTFVLNTPSTAIFVLKPTWLGGGIEVCVCGMQYGCTNFMLLIVFCFWRISDRLLVKASLDTQLILLQSVERRLAVLSGFTMDILHLLL